MDGPALLKRWRQSEGLSQEDAAEKVGVHQNTWSDWETGQKTPTTPRAIRLAVITEGACPIEAWADDDATRDGMRVLLQRLAGAAA